MNDPYIRADVQRIYDSKCILPITQGNFQHARAETLEWLCNVRHPAVCYNRQGVEKIVLGTLRKALEIFACAFNPRNRPRVSRHLKMVTNLSPPVKGLHARYQNRRGGQPHRCSLHGSTKIESPQSSNR